MIGKKIFGIGAGVILILLSLAPIINASNIENEIKEKVTGNLAVVEMETILKNCQYEKAIEEDEQDYVIYNIDYELKIQGTLFKDRPYETIRTNLETVDGKIRYTWNQNISQYLNEKCLTNTFTIPLTKKITIKSNEDINLDEEIKFADKEIFIEVNPLTFLDINSENNIDYGYSQYYNYNTDYQPTKTHLLLSTPHKYKRIEKNYNNTILYRIELVNSLSDEDDVPTPLIDRLGYIYPLLEILSEIVYDISVIFDVFISFYFSCRDDFKILYDWLEEGLSMLSKAVKGIPVAMITFLDWLKKLEEITPAIQRIVAASIVTGGIIKDKIADLYEDILNLIKLKNSKPWENPVEIDLEIDMNKEGETIGINCREVWLNPSDDDKDKKIKINFPVSSEPREEDPKPKEIWWLHNCRTRVHCGDLTKKSIKILSYSFSSGKIKYQFDLNLKGKINFRENIFIENPIFQKLISKINLIPLNY